MADDFVALKYMGVYLFLYDSFIWSNAQLKKVCSLPLFMDFGELSPDKVNKRAFSGELQMGDGDHSKAGGNAKHPVDSGNPMNEGI